MLPYKHFLTSTLVIAPIALSMGKSAEEIGLWVLIGGVVSMVIDLDVLTITIFKSKTEPKLKPFVSLLEIHKKYKQFMDTAFETGVLKIVAKTHLISFALIILLSYFYFYQYFIPITIGVVFHSINDLPVFWRVIKNR